MQLLPSLHAMEDFTEMPEKEHVRLVRRQWQLGFDPQDVSALAWVVGLEAIVSWELFKFRV
eukprot:1237608-Lingulodinium_polyedra.AAC.1